MNCSTLAVNPINTRHLHKEEDQASEWDLDHFHSEVPVSVQAKLVSIFNEATLTH